MIKEYNQIKSICDYKNIDSEKVLELIKKFSKDKELRDNSIYEYSFNQKDGGLKILNLISDYGWHNPKRKDLYEKRKKQIKTIFNFCIKGNSKLILLDKLLEKCSRDYILNIAFEFSKKDLEKIKIYFCNSNRFKKNPPDIIKFTKSIFNILNTKDKIKDNQLMGEGIDSIGIDFSKDKSSCIKLYTYFNNVYTSETIKDIANNEFKKYNINVPKDEFIYDKLSQFLKKTLNLDYNDWGFLYRINVSGDITSVKFWYRLDKKENLNYLGFKTSYLTFENEYMDYYFRADSKNKDYFLKELTEKIAATDFTGYTLQYPPVFLWDQVRGKKNLKDSMIISNEDKLGLYIHIPFCNQRCWFCRYYSKTENDSKKIDIFLDYFKKEISLYLKYLKNKKFHTLYIGGGTPSILTSNQLIRFCDLINDNFDFIDSAQRCIELNPNSTTYNKLKILKDKGFNRLTIGIQSLNEKVLEKTKRIQKEEDVQEAIKNAKKLNFENINVDVMTGLQGETKKSFITNLKKIIDLDPDMIHLHPFYPTPYTEFEKNGEHLSEKEKVLRKEMSDIGEKLLFAANYKGIKFDANGKSESSRNIQLSDAIENISSYIGLGPGAVSHIRGRIRYLNGDSIKDYYSSLDKGNFPIIKCYNLSKKDEMIYYITACLRYGGVSKKEFYELFNEDLNDIFPKTIEYLKSRKLIKEDNNNIRMESNNIGEYLIYSKYFYDSEMIQKSKESMNYKSNKEIITEQDIEYMNL